MVKGHKYSCTSQLGAEILMVITSFLTAISLLLLFFQSMFHSRFISDNIASLFLSSTCALFLPLMSYMFSQAKQYDQEGRAQLILIWMVLMENIHIRGDPIFTWELRKSVVQLVRIFWVGYLVCSYTPLHGIRTSLFILCVFFACSEIMKGIIFNIAKYSYLIGKHPKLIHNYVKSIMHGNEHKTTPLSECAYIVMGEEDHNIVISSNGCHLGKKKRSNSKGKLTIGSVFTQHDRAISWALPSLHDTCLSLALAKMLRRRFSNLPVDEEGCEKALDFVLKGLIGYFVPNGGIQTARNDEERNLTDRLYRIIEDELKYVYEFLHAKVPTFHHFVGYIMVDLIGLIIMVGTGIYLIFTICKRDFSQLSLVAPEAYSDCFFHMFRRGSVVVKTFSILDQAITILLVVACIYVQINASKGTADRWFNLRNITKYIENPDKWNSSYSSFVAFYSTKLLSSLKFYKKKLQGSQKGSLKVGTVYSSVLDTDSKNIKVCIEIDSPILQHFLRWIKSKIPRSFPTVVLSTTTKKFILASLTNSGGKLTNGETSLKDPGLEPLNWACQPDISITEVILVWHIATALFHHKKHSPQQDNNPSMESQEVALQLSSYCHYLVKYRPELLPDEVEWADKAYRGVRKDMLSIATVIGKKPTKEDCCKYILEKKEDTWIKDSVTAKGVKLANILLHSAKDEGHVWNMLAEFWTEMMLFIAPSDNVKGHENILLKGELITQLWALLTHAGIVTRPEPTKHQDHQSESRDGAQMSPIVSVERITPSDNVEGDEEIKKTGDELEVHQSDSRDGSERRTMVGGFCVKRPLIVRSDIVDSNEEIIDIRDVVEEHQSESRDGAQMSTMVDEFRVEMLSIAQSGNVEGNEKIIERGGEPEVHQSERIRVNGDESV